ncbi:MAG: ATP synthase F1 subunit delta [Patescibacteria group bacterium]
MDAVGKPALTYGQALAEYAQERGDLPEVIEDLKTANVAFAQAELSGIFANPLVPRKVKHELIDRIFAGRTGETFRSFLHVVVERRRERLLGGIVEAALHACLARQGIEVVFVTTPAVLPEDLREEIRLGLKKALGVEVYPEFRVNANLLGGIVIRRGDQLLDASVMGILHRLGEQMIGGVRLGQG